MAEIEKFMNVSAGDIAKIMNVEVGDIAEVMTIELSTSIAWLGVRHIGASNGGTTATLKEIDYKTSTSGGNTADWGDLIYGGYWHRGAWNRSRLNKRAYWFSCSSLWVIYRRL